MNLNLTGSGSCAAYKKKAGLEGRPDILAVFYARKPPNGSHHSGVFMSADGVARLTPAAEGGFESGSQMEG